jgi:hypothetical protein
MTTRFHRSPLGGLLHPALRSGAAANPRSERSATTNFVRPQPAIRALVTSAACVLGAFASEKTASAYMVWEPLGTGCASSIAVGPNNVPWVVGCASAGNPVIASPQEVYYLNGGPGAPAGQPSNCSGTEGGFPILNCAPVWKSDNFQAVTIAVNIDGFPFATDSVGHVYEDMPCNVTLSNGGPGCASPAKPNGSWVHVTHPAVSSFAIGNNVRPYPAEMWESPTYGPPPSATNDKEEIWGVGCGSSCSAPLTVNHSLWSGTITDGDTPALPGGSWSGWSPMGGAAVTFALFTDAIGAGQTPWVLDQNGVAFVSAGGGWVPEFLPNQSENPFAYQVESLTDHFALQRTNGVVYQWTGTSSGVNPGWSEYISDLDTDPPGGFTWITKIAWSQSYVVNGVTYGPSMLWGVDINGNIYYAKEYFPPITPK